MIASFLAGGKARLTPARLTMVLVACLAVCALVALLTPLVGVVTPQGRLDVMSPHAIWSDDLDSTVYWRVRLPRTLAALLCGAALAGAGCAFQAVLRNPLAEPFTLGVSSGASLAAVLAIRVGLASPLGTAGVGGAAVIGAIAAVAIVWRLARVGDALSAGVIIHAQKAADVKVTALVDAGGGIVLDDNGTIGTTATKTVSVEAGKAKEVRFAMKATTPARARFR
jgi:iron complex transport system permease protein